MNNTLSKEFPLFEAARTSAYAVGIAMNIVQMTVMREKRTLVPTAFQYDAGKMR